MLDEPRIEEIVREIAGTQIDKSGLERVISQSTIDSTGDDALRITLVLRPEAVRELLTGDQALELLVGIQRKLEQDGEQRLAILEYATEQELQSERDDQPDEDDL